MIKVKQRKNKTVNTKAYMIYIATLTYFSKESPNTTNFSLKTKQKNVNEMLQFNLPKMVCCGHTTV